jgi:hypothetical protein
MEELWGELWVSIASLLRSYTAVHGLHEGIEAAIEFDPHRIMATNGKRWLHLERSNNAVTWMRENGTSGVLELTDHGRLRARDPKSQNRDMGHPEEQEMDMAAEAWARELMQ